MTTDLLTADEGLQSSDPSRKSRMTKWIPYFLIAPTIIFLALFFAYPMLRGLSLAIYDDEAILQLHEEPAADSDVTGSLRQNAPLEVQNTAANVVEATDEDSASSLVTEIWFEITGPDATSGESISGWSPETRIRVRSEDDAGNPLTGTVRSRIGSDETLTDVHTEATDVSAVVGQIEERTEVQISDQIVLEVWYLVSGEDDDSEVASGWAQSRNIQVFDDGVSGRVDRGDSGEFTTRYFQTMVNNRFFYPALKMTLLLMVIIIPVQFLLAVVMALVIQARLRGNTTWLYVFSIPLGVSDLAVGILFFLIFTENGFLNSILQLIGLIDEPNTYLSAETIPWIVFAIFLAEVWRATAIVMIIIVSGLQAISDEILEAAELFGANLWRRVRYVILPLLKPSVMVALILRTILALQVFAVVIALSGGDVVTVLTNETFRWYDELRNPNVAAAYAVLILSMSMISSGLYLYALRSQREVSS